jgi:hypothetical protein
MLPIPALAALLSLLPFSSSPVADGCELLLRDGSRRTARAVAGGAGKPLALTDAAGAVTTVPLGDVVALDWIRPAPPATDGAMTLLLHDGSRLVGRVGGGDEEQLSFELTSGGTLAFPLDSVRALFAGPRHGELDVDRFAVGGAGDSLHRRAESGGDYTRGTVVSVDAAGVRFEYSLGTSHFPWSDLEALLLEQQVDPAPPSGNVVEVDLEPDGKLVSELVRITASDVVVKRGDAGGELVLPLASVAALRFRGEGWSWLADLKPSAVKQTPYLGGSDDFLFPWRRDRTVTGHPLRVHERRYGSGLGCHARCELSFPIPAGSRLFLADAGLSDEVLALPERGAAEFRVLVDGVERWRSVLARGGDDAQRTGLLDVAGGKVVTLVVDFGTGEDVADRAVWGSPLLLR